LSLVVSLIRCCMYSHLAGKMYLLVMGNVFDTDRVIHQRYDLKVRGGLRP
jgi:hypothetical protein